MTYRILLDRDTSEHAHILVKRVVWILYSSCRVGRETLSHLIVHTYVLSNKKKPYRLIRIQVLSLMVHEVVKVSNRADTYIPASVGELCSESCWNFSEKILMIVFYFISLWWFILREKQVRILSLLCMSMLHVHPKKSQFFHIWK